LKHLHCDDLHSVTILGGIKCWSLLGVKGLK